MMKRILMAMASLLAMAAATPSAEAADLAPMRAPPPSVYNWTGFYIGLNGGGGWGRQDPLNLITDRFDAFNVSFSGGLAGGTSGAQIQLAHVVLGFESDIDWTDIRGHAIVTPTIFGVPQPFLINMTTKMDWFGTARARIGYAADNWMLYATGGLAIIGAKTTLNTLAGPVCGTFGVFNCEGSDKRAGAAAGAGIEYGFLPNWSAKVEYLYVTAFSFEVSHVNLVRAGINYRFGGL